MQSKTQAAPASTALSADAVLDMRSRATQDDVRSGPAASDDALRLREADWAFTTRLVPRERAQRILTAPACPRAGDLVLARVDAIGHHGALQLVQGRRRSLFSGTEIVVAYGNRYASNQFEAVVPQSIGPCHLVAGGGIAARARSWHSRISRGPTQITPIGLLGDAAGRRISLRDHALATPDPTAHSLPAPSVIAVLGTSMDAGKTTTCVHLVRGLIAAGLRVGYAKVTGTGAGGDYWALRDAGANPVLDFTDIGHASTYMLDVEQVAEIQRRLLAHLHAKGVDAVVLEVADGLLQCETEALVRQSEFTQTVGGIVLAASDSMGALAGCHALRSLPVPVLALSGLLSAAPLQVAEAQRAIGVPIHGRTALATPEIALRLLGESQASLRSRCSVAAPSMEDPREES